MEKNLAQSWEVFDLSIAKEVFQDVLPITAGIIPFGLTCGIIGSTAGFSTFEITFMSIAVFAGAAQFMALAMIGAGVTSWSLLVFTTFLINLRHLLMGASLAPYLLKLSRPLQYFLAFSMTDESYALTYNRIANRGYDFKYHLGVSGVLYSSWVLATFLGAYFYQIIPDPLEWGIDFIIPATFLVLLAPRLVDRVALIVCLISGVSAVLGAVYLPGKWYIIVAAITATVAGGFLERGKKHGS